MSQKINHKYQWQGRLSSDDPVVGRFLEELAKADGREAREVVLIRWIKTKENIAENGKKKKGGWMKRFRRHQKS